jgi:decaprenyl-phosphate phosphoribosyltransferase
LAMVENRTASPTTIVLQDRFLQVVLALWILSFFFLLYLGSHKGAGILPE